MCNHKVAICKMQRNNDDESCEYNTCFEHRDVKESILNGSNINIESKMVGTRIMKH